MGLGTASTKVSTRDELLREPKVTIDSGTYTHQLSGGAPAHTPEVAVQSCTDVQTGQVHEWWAGAWH